MRKCESNEMIFFKSLLCKGDRIINKNGTNLNGSKSEHVINPIAYALLLESEYIEFYK